MTHGDDDGIVLPPMVAPAHVVLLPIIRKPEDRAIVMPYVDSLAEALKQKSYGNRKIGVEVDNGIGDVYAKIAELPEARHSGLKSARAILPKRPFSSDAGIGINRKRFP